MTNKFIPLSDEDIFSTKQIPETNNHDVDTIEHSSKYNPERSLDPLIRLGLSFKTEEEKPFFLKETQPGLEFLKNKAGREYIYDPQADQYFPVDPHPFERGSIWGAVRDIPGDVADLGAMTVRDIPKIAGAVAGAPLGPAGAIAGGGVGGGLGALWEKNIANMLPGVSSKSLTLPTQTENVGWGVVEGLTGEAANQKLLQLATQAYPTDSALKYLKGEANPEYLKESQQAMREGSPDLDLAQATGSQEASAVKQALLKTSVGQKLFHAQQSKQIQQARALIELNINKLLEGSPLANPEIVGKNLGNDIVKFGESFVEDRYNATRPLITEIKSLAGGRPTIYIDNLISTVKEALAKSSQSKTKQSQLNFILNTLKKASTHANELDSGKVTPEFMLDALSEYGRGIYGHPFVVEISPSDSQMLSRDLFKAAIKDLEESAARIIPSDLGAASKMGHPPAQFTGFPKIPTSSPSRFTQYPEIYKQQTFHPTATSYAERTPSSVLDAQKSSDMELSKKIISFRDTWKTLSEPINEFEQSLAKNVAETVLKGEPDIAVKNLLVTESITKLRSTMAVLDKASPAMANQVRALGLQALLEKSPVQEYMKAYIEPGSQGLDIAKLSSLLNDPLEYAKLNALFNNHPQVMIEMNALKVGLNRILNTGNPIYSEITPSSTSRFIRATIGGALGKAISPEVGAPMGAAYGAIMSSPSSGPSPMAQRLLRARFSNKALAELLIDSMGRKELLGKIEIPSSTRTATRIGSVLLTPEREQQ